MSAGCSADNALALQLISEYLDEPTMRLLSAALAIEEPIVVNTSDAVLEKKRKSDWEVEAEVRCGYCCCIIVKSKYLFFVFD